MTRSGSTTALPAQILDLLNARYGQPMAGGQIEQLRSAVAQLVSLAARQQALRELIAFDEALRDRIKVTQLQRKRH